MNCETCKWESPETCKVCKQGKTEKQKDANVYDALCKYYSKLYGLKEAQ